MRKRRKTSKLQRLLDKEIFIPAAAKHGIEPQATGFAYGAFMDLDGDNFIRALGDEEIVFGDTDEEP